MQASNPQTLVEEFFHRIATAKDVNYIAELVSDDVDWFIAGDEDIVPWIGRKVGKTGVAEFYSQLRDQITSERFEIRDILSQDNRVVVIGELASRVNRTGKLIETEFVFDFLVENGVISRFRLFEDSLAGAKACH